MKFTDPILNKLVRKYPAPSFIDRSAYLMEDLVESIISQQLSVKASNTIYGRFLLLFKQSSKDVLLVSKAHPESSTEGSWTSQDDTPNPFPTPQQILSTSDEKMRACGISFQKISYIKSVADAFLSDLIDIQKIKNMTDEEVIAALTQIRGVGKWTAEMILIFTLKRPDVFSLGDLGLRNAITRLYGISDQKEMLALSQKWQPNRSTACWYLWRSLENK